MNLDIELNFYNGIAVLRDDKLIGGTKSRFLKSLLDETKDGYVYATPVFGGFQIALSEVATSMGKRAILFTPERKKRHYNTIKCAQAGGVLFEVKPGYLSVLQKRAKDFIKHNPDYQYIEFGANYEIAIDSIAKTMRKVSDELGKEPKEIYCAVGSGTLVKGILKGTDQAEVTGVVVGKEFNFKHERLRLIKYPKPFDKVSNYKAPFQSMPNYDLKALEVCMQLKKHNETLFWNVY